MPPSVLSHFESGEADKSIESATGTVMQHRIRVRLTRWPEFHFLVPLGGPADFRNCSQRGQMPKGFVAVTKRQAVVAYA